jgi:hypothetical protein
MFKKTNKGEIYITTFYINGIFVLSIDVVNVIGVFVAKASKYTRPLYPCIKYVPSDIFGKV